MSPQDWQDGSVLGSVAASVVAAILFLRRKLSKDNVEVKRDSAEIDLIDKLIAERDQALESLALARKREDDAWQARNEDAKKIGRLEAQVENLVKEVHALRQELSNYKPKGGDDEQP